MNTTYSTPRLDLQPLSIEDAGFIHELVNTDGWLRFIGDRNVTDADSAQAYVQRIMDNAAVNYWVVRLKTEGIPIGIITLIKRDYLEHRDLGFAFLPEYSGSGYAYESANAVMQELLRVPEKCVLLATTMAENKSSIKLLERLGFRMRDTIVAGGESLLLYGVTNDGEK